MKNIKSVAIACLCFIFIFILSACSGKEKFVGSKDTKGFYANTVTYESLDHMKNDSKLIVIASFKNDPTVETEKFHDEIIYSTKYELNISEVIKGNISDKTIYLLQTGKPDSDDYETKIKKNHKYILFLNPKSFKGITVYDTAGAEQGICEIKSDKKLLSYTDDGIMPKYDNENSNKLLSDLQQISSSQTSSKIQNTGSTKQ